MTPASAVPIGLERDRAAERRPRCRVDPVPELLDCKVKRQETNVCPSADLVSRLPGHLAEAGDQARVAVSQAEHLPHEVLPIRHRGALAVQKVLDQPTCFTRSQVGQFDLRKAPSDPPQLADLAGDKERTAATIGTPRSSASSSRKAAYAPRT